MLDALRFMAVPIAACLLLPGLLVYLGLHIVRREIIFVDLALAQVAALGTSLCLIWGHNAQDYHTYLWSFGFTLIGAGIFSMTRSDHPHRVQQEALIGIVYVVAAALGIMILSRSAEGNEELRRTLIGDVLTVKKDQVTRTFLLYIGIAVIHYFFRKQFLKISFEPEAATRDGMRVRWWDFLFYALFGVVVTTFLQIGGVLLVFSYLIIPAVCANYVAVSLGGMLAFGILAASLGSLAGLFISYKYEFPTGSSIVCSLGAILLLVSFGSKLLSKKPKSDAKS